MDIQAIQTFYRGTYYRSRIEARWAVFFDVLGLKHEHEPDKFELPSGRYIPDFRVLTGQCSDNESLFFLEVKGAAPTAHEAQRFAEFTDITGFRHAFLVHGPVRDYTIIDSREDCGRRYAMRWIQCPFCGAVGLFDWRFGHPNDHPVEKFECPAGVEILKTFDVDGFFLNIDPPTSPSISIALSTAQSARFEDPSFEKIVAAQSQSVIALKQAGVFCDPRWTAELSRKMDSLRNNPDCPRWYWEGRPREMSLVQ
jgi:hypothetical protein